MERKDDNDVIMKINLNANRDCLCFMKMMESNKSTTFDFYSNIFILNFYIN